MSHLDVCSFWRVVVEISARHDTSDRSSWSVKLLKMADDQHDNVGDRTRQSWYFHTVRVHAVALLDTWK